VDALALRYDYRRDTAHHHLKNSPSAPPWTKAETRGGSAD
jgi:hypothetical protein